MLDEKNEFNKLTIIVIITVGVWVLLEIIFGELFRTSNGMVLIQNGQCFKFLGCNNGFFGYDAIVHFSAGIFEAPLIVFMFNKYYNINLFHIKKSLNNFWKNLIILTAVLVLIGFLWEVLELIDDQFRINILHQVLLLPDSFNHLAQGSNIDTMGDIIFGVLGGLIGNWFFGLLDYIKQ